MTWMGLADVFHLSSIHSVLLWRLISILSMDLRLGFTSLMLSLRSVNTR